MTNDFKDPKHPIWALAEKALVLFAGLMAVLWANATKFDETEVKAASQFMALVGSYFGVKNLVAATKGKPE